MQQLSQSCLRQADVRPQRQDHLAEGIVALTISRGSFHGSSPFLLTHQSTTMKQCEVTRHLMDGDFPRQQRYTGIYQVCTPFGSTPVWGCLGAISSDPRQPLLFSAPMIADFLADDEHLAHVLLVSLFLEVKQVE
jgi:hypothetical protein